MIEEFIQNYKDCTVLYLTYFAIVYGIVTLMLLADQRFGNNIIPPEVEFRSPKFRSPAATA
jgi:hypothetical protein